MLREYIFFLAAVRMKGSQWLTLAKLGFDAMLQGETLTVHGLFNRLRIQSLRLAPRALATAITAAILKS